MWNDHLGRVDRALWHWQQAWKLEPHKTEALDAARVLYQSLGDEAMVAKLYQAELEVLGGHGPAQRKAQIRLELGKLALRAKNLEAAANHLEEGARLDADVARARRGARRGLLEPGLSRRSDTPQGGELFVELGRRRLATRDIKRGSIISARVGVDPYAKGSSEALEGALSETSQWDELDRILRHRSAVVQDPAERTEVLRRRAALYRNQLPNREGLVEVLTELVAYEAPGSKGVPRAARAASRNRGVGEVIAADGGRDHGARSGSEHAARGSGRRDPSSSRRSRASTWAIAIAPRSCCIRRSA